MVELTTPLLADIAARRGWKLMVLTSVGFRHIGAKHPVRTANDLRTLRLRSQPSPWHDRLWTAMGSRTRPSS